MPTSRPIALQRPPPTAPLGARSLRKHAAAVKSRRVPRTQGPRTRAPYSRPRVSLASRAPRTRGAEYGARMLSRGRRLLWVHGGGEIPCALGSSRVQGRGGSRCAGKGMVDDDSSRGAPGLGSFHIRCQWKGQVPANGKGAQNSARSRNAPGENPGLPGPARTGPGLNRVKGPVRAGHPSQGCIAERGLCWHTVTVTSARRATCFARVPTLRLKPPPAGPGRLARLSMPDDDSDSSVQ